MYLPAYVESHAFNLPGYVQPKSSVIDANTIPHWSGVEWHPLSEIYFKLGTLERIFDFCVLNKRPILIIIEGPSGEAKTSLTISLLGWALWRYSRTKLTVKNFRKYFLMGEYISLRPDIMVKNYKPKQFFALDEAHLAINRMRSNSKQNRDANKFANTIREKQIFGMFTTITSQELDKMLVNYKVSLRLLVKYNSQKKKILYFDVQVNCKGINMDNGRQLWEYLPLQKNRSAKWCPTDLWDLSKGLKDDNVMGGSINTIKTYDQNITEANDRIKVDTHKDLKAGIFARYTEVKDMVRAFHRAGYNQTDTRATINAHLLEKGEKTLSYDKLKTYLQQIQDET